MMLDRAPEMTDVRHPVDYGLPDCECDNVRKAETFEIRAIDALTFTVAIPQSAAKRRHLAMRGEILS